MAIKHYRTISMTNNRVFEIVLFLYIFFILLQFYDYNYLLLVVLLGARAESNNIIDM